MNLPDTETHRYRRIVKSQTSSNEYVVSQRISTGVWECSCRGWTTHRKCKHIDALPEAAIVEHIICYSCYVKYPGIPAILAPVKTTGLCCWCSRTVHPVYAVNVLLMPPCQGIHLEDVVEVN